MNYREYAAVMAVEGLEESRGVQMLLAHAKWCQRVMRGLTPYLKKSLSEGRVGLFDQVTKLESEKTAAIEAAIDLARKEKEFGWKVVEDADQVILAAYQVDQTPAVQVILELVNMFQEELVA